MELEDVLKLLAAFYRRKQFFNENPLRAAACFGQRSATADLVDIDSRLGESRAVFGEAFPRETDFAVGRIFNETLPECFLGFGRERFKLISGKRHSG